MNAERRAVERQIANGDASCRCGSPGLHEPGDCPAALPERQSDDAMRRIWNEVTRNCNQPERGE